MHVQDINIVLVGMRFGFLGLTSFVFKAITQD